MKFHTLVNIYDKEKICYGQKVSSSLILYKESADYTKQHDMKQAIQNAVYFLKYLRGEEEPERPRGSGKKGYYFQNDDFVAFKGLGKEISMFFHMLIIPTLKHGYDEQNDKIVLSSVQDLKKEHIPLLINMKNEFIKFVKHNEKWFCKIYRIKNLEFWLNPDKFQFGFHWPPTVGYLHMHAMVGPITEHGESMKDRWVSLENVIENLSKQ